MPKMIRLFLITALILTVFISGMDVSADTAENFQEIT